MPRRWSAIAFWHSACSVVAITAFAASVAQAADTAAISRDSEGPALVQAALDAELAGDGSRRDALLAEAVKVDPNFAPAHWHAGEVNFDGQWRRLEDVQQLVANDQRWVGYRELRDQLGLESGDHLLLAEYCRDHKLDDEGWYHWTNVLLANPGNKAARAYLGVQERRGRLFTREQVAAMETWAKEAEENLKRHRPTLARLCRDATHGDAAARAAALAKISALEDPTSMAALEEAAEKACERSPRFAEEVHQAVVAALGNMPHHEATLRLLNHTIYADSPAVRQAASRALRPRPQTDYAPLLMAALRAPIEVEFDVLATPDGSVRVSEIIRQRGPQAEAVHTRQTNMLTEGAFGHDPNASNPAVVLGANLGRASDRLAATEVGIEAANADAETMNARIEDALRLATGDDMTEGAQAWWASWESYNELQSLANEEEITTSEEAHFVYYYPQAPVLYPSSEAPTNGKLSPSAEPHRAPVKRLRNNAVIEPRRRWRNNAPRSCFAPGTPVWTPAGPVAIEEISIGDFVLSQNPHTGELDFRPVVALTVSEPVPVRELVMESETIVSTRGHRFWAPGQGWLMAKHLTSGERLLALGGSVAVERIRDGQSVACYNLAVDGYHTYFVGKRQLLVHDLTCPEAELASIPGSQTPRPWTPPVVRSPVNIQR